MHENMADWYRIASINTSGEILEKRWNAIVNFSKTINVDETLHLVRLFYDRPAVDDVFMEKFKSQFKNEDPLFQMMDNQLELSLLAGLIAVNLLDHPEDVSDATALGIVCRSFVRDDISTSVPDLVDRSRKFLDDRGVEVRESNEIGNINLIAGHIFEQKLEALGPQLDENNLPGAKDNLMETLRSMVTELRTLSAATSKAIEALKDNQLALIEQTNISWWIAGRYSTDLRKPMLEVELPVAALVVAKELADHTDLLPGPVSAQGFLDVALSDSLDSDKSKNSVSVKDAVTLASRKWLEACLQNYPLGACNDLFPVLSAMQISLNIEGDWVPTYRTQLGMKSIRQIPASNLAYQLYLELTLSSLIAQEG